MRRFSTVAHVFSIFIAISCYQQAFAQVAIGTSSSTPTPDKDAVLLLVGNGSQGLIIPVVTSLGAFGKAGMVVYNSITATIHYSNGTTWTQVGGGGTVGIQVNGNSIQIGTGNGFNPTMQVASAAPNVNGQILTWNSALNGGNGGWTSSASIAPSVNGQVMKWNGSQWAPGNDDTGGGAASGDLTTTTPGLTIINGTKAMNGVGTILNIQNATSSQGGLLTQTDWNTFNSKLGSLPTLGGDISGTLPAVSVDKLKGTAISGTPPTVNQILQYNGTNWAPAPLPGGTVANLTSTTTGLTITGGNAAVNGTGTTINIQNANTSQGGLLTSTDWNTFNNKLSSLPTPGGDISGSLPALSVDKLKGTAVSATAPATNQVLQYNGTNWAPATLAAESDPNVKAINGLVKSNGTTIGAVVSGTDIKTINSTSLLGSGNISVVATETDPTVKAISGIVKSNGTTIGPVVSGTDIKTINSTSLLGSGNISVVATETDPAVKAISGIVKSNGTTISAATAGTDYVATESDPSVKAINGLVKSNGTTVGAVVSGTDIKTINSTSLLGSGNISVVATETDPSVKAINGLVKSNGTTISAATAGTDYLTPTGSAAGLTSFPTFNQNTTGTAATITGNITEGQVTNLTTDLANKVTSNTAITGATSTKITYDAKGLVTSGTTLVAADIPNLAESQVTNLTTDLATKVTSNTAITGATNTKITYDAKGLVTGGAALAATDLPVMTSTVGGAVPTPPNNTTTFLRGDGTFAVPASGTVTSVSVTTANGVSGTVATPTTTPAISLTLGAITPTSVAATGTVTGSNLSGTNTGDQTNIPGNAATVTTNANLTGPVTSTGNATAIAAGAITNAMLAGSIAASNLVGTDITTVGTITSGTWNGGRIVETSGGTNQTAYATGDILYASGVNTLSKLPIGTTNQVLTVNSGVPAWASATAGWGLSGNAVTGTDFIGTSNAQDLVFKINGAENMRIKQSGYVGIGTTIPGAKLTVQGATTYDAALGLVNTGGGTDWRISSDTDGALKFIKTSGATFPVLTLNSNGAIGIYDGSSVTFGTAGQVLTSGGPSGLPIWGPAGVGWGLSGNAAAATDFIGTSNAQDLVFKTNGNEVQRITATGKVGIGTATPSYMTEIVSPGSGGSNQVLSLGTLHTNSHVDLTAMPTGGGDFRISSTSNGISLLTGGGTTRMRIDGAGKIGIGNTSPSEILDVTGNVRFSGALMPNNLSGTTGQVLTSAGPGAPPTWAPGGWDLKGNTSINPSINFIGTTDSQPLIFKVNGTFSGKIDPSSSNQSFGYNAGGAITSGLQNSFFGNSSGQAVTSGYNNTAFGYASLVSVTTANDNTAIGYATLNYNTAAGNTAVGAYSSASNTTGTNNTSVGSSSLNTNTTGGNNVAIGTASLKSNSTGTGNIGVGYFSLGSNTLGIDNVAVGDQALSNNIQGKSNIGIGSNALIVNTTGDNNVGMGTNALQGNSVGSGNVALGFQAGMANNGSLNTLIGSDANVASGSLTNATAIGSRAQVAADNSIVLGSISGVNGATASTNVGIGTTTPSTTLEVEGDMSGGGMLISSYVSPTAISSVSAVSYAVFGTQAQTIIPVYIPNGTSKLRAMVRMKATAPATTTANIRLAITDGTNTDYSTVASNTTFTWSNSAEITLTFSTVTTRGWLTLQVEGQGDGINGPTLGGFQLYVVK